MRGYGFGSGRFGQSFATPRFRLLWKVCGCPPPPPRTPPPPPSSMCRVQKSSGAGLWRCGVIFLAFPCSSCMRTNQHSRCSPPKPRLRLQAFLRAVCCNMFMVQLLTHPEAPASRWRISMALVETAALWQRHPKTDQAVTTVHLNLQGPNWPVRGRCVALVRGHFVGLLSSDPDQTFEPREAFGAHQIPPCALRAPLITMPGLHEPHWRHRVCTNSRCFICTNRTCLCPRQALLACTAEDYFEGSLGWLNVPRSC